MKVILLRDVAKLGRRSSIVEVPDGFALNKLIPQGYAQAASAENLKRVNEHSEKKASARTSELEDFKASLEALQDTKIKITVDANAQGHLFKSVKTTDLAASLVSAHHSIPLASIKLADPIKSLGEYPVTVTMGDVSGVVNFEVVSK
jgi:large subunit ribosomal protein L9